jgi:hypothetical protein
MSEKGIPPTPDDEFWMTKMREVAGGSIASIEESAKQLITMITVMQGIYAAVLAFSGIKEMPKGSIIVLLLYGLPLFVWLGSLFFALRVFWTREYKYFANSPDSAKDTFLKIATDKHKDVRLAYILFTISFIVAAAGIMYWLYTGSQPLPPHLPPRIIN